MFLLVPAHPGSPRQRAVKRVCVCICAGMMDGIRQQREMEAAVSNVGSMFTDDQVNNLTLTHFENLQVNFSSSCTVFKDEIHLCLIYFKIFSWFVYRC